MKGAKTVDEYIAKSDSWRDELKRLREILNDTPLEETVKWGMPYYTWKGKNVVSIAAFSSYFGLWFTQGALLKDTEKILVNAQEGKTKALRQWRMTSAKEIKARTIKAYVKEAIAVVDEGREIKPARKKAIVIPAELKTALNKDNKTAASFKKLTPGKQREYTAYIAEAKQAATKQRRIGKIVPMIQSGAGLNDKYKNC